MTKVFDTLGRHRPVNYDQQLTEVRKRKETHRKNCKHCLQFMAGYRKHLCPTGKQIEGHERVVTEALRRHEAGLL